MCGLIGFGIAGLIGAVALIFGIGSLFNGMAAFSTSLALLGQTLLQPVVMIVVAAVGFVGGAGFVLGAPRIVEFYSRVKSGQVQALRDARPAKTLVADSRRQLPAGQATRHHVTRRRRTARVNLDRRW